MVKRAIFALLSALVCGGAWAAPETTTITGTIYVGGTLATGGSITATLSANGVTPDGGSDVQAPASTTTALSGSGTFSITLTPNDAIRPSTTYYDVRVTVTTPTSSSWRERWLVTTSPDPTTYGAVTKINVVPGQIIYADYVRYVAAEPTGTCTANESPRIATTGNKFCVCSSGTWSCSGMAAGDGDMLKATYDSDNDGFVDGLDYGTLLPGTPTTGDVFVVTDDSASGACDSAAGSAVTLCRWNGSAWAALGGGGGVTGPGSSTDNTLVRFSGTGGSAIDSASSNLPTLADDGDVTLEADLDLPMTIGGSGTGVIYKDGTRFLHNYAEEATPTNRGGNTFLGESAGNFTMGGSNDYNGSRNTGIGQNVLDSVTTGYYNTAVGWNAMTGVTTGRYNACVGPGCFQACTGCIDNTGIGQFACGDITDGSLNVCLGEDSGGLAPASITTGDYNVFVGAQAGVANAGLTDAQNCIAIGYQAQCTASNQVILGNASVTTTTLRGTVSGTFSGNLTGNVTGTVSGNAGTVTVADAADDTTTWPLLGTSATAVGGLAPATDSSLTYNASTGALTATTFVGALTGNASTASDLSGCTNCIGPTEVSDIALGTDTTGNYVSSATASQGLLLTGTEGASLGLIDCAANEVLKRNAGDTEWSCASDLSGGGGTANILDLGDDAGNDSTDLVEIATTGDTNSIFTEPSADKLLIAVGNDWPKADLADDLSSACTDCIGTTEIADSYLLNSGDSGTGSYDFGGATGFEIPNDAAPTVDATGEIAIDTTITNYKAMLTFYDGTAVRYIPNLLVGELAGTDDYIIKYDGASDEFKLEADATGAGGGIATVEENNVTVTTSATNLDFLGADFDVSGATVEADVSIAAAITRDSEVTTADAAGDTTTFPMLATAATGLLAPATDAGLTYNATTDALGAGSFVAAQSASGGSLELLEATGGSNKLVLQAPTSITSDGTCTLLNVTDRFIPNSCIETIDTADITDGTITEADLKVVDTASDEECFTYESTTGDFEWQACGSGNVATDTIWDAAGDLAVGSGADTAVKLAKGTNGQILKTGASTLEWADAVVITESTPASGHILIYDGTDSYDNKAVSGDVTITSAGAVTIADNSVDGTDIAVGSDTAGDVLYYNGTDWVRLAIGTPGQVLEVNTGGTAPEWDTDDGAAGGDSITVNTSGTATDANFLDNIYIDWSLNTTPSPDDITAKPNYNAASGDHGLLTTEVAFAANGLVAEGTTADTIEAYLQFPDPAGSDVTITLPAATGTLVTSNDINTSSELATILTDETGTGAAVFADSPTFADDVSFAQVTADATRGIIVTTTQPVSTAVKSGWTWQTVPPITGYTYPISCTSYNLTGMCTGTLATAGELGFTANWEWAWDWDTGTGGRQQSVEHNWEYRTSDGVNYYRPFSYFNKDNLDSGKGINVFDWKVVARPVATSPGGATFSTLQLDHDVTNDRPLVSVGRTAADTPSGSLSLFVRTGGLGSSPVDTATNKNALFVQALGTETNQGPGETVYNVRGAEIRSEFVASVADSDVNEVRALDAVAEFAPTSTGHTGEKVRGLSSTATMNATGDTITWLVGLETQLNATAGTVSTAMADLLVRTPGTGATINGDAYGAYFYNRGAIGGNSSAVIGIASQSGTGSNEKGNLWFEGGNATTGHIEMGAGHFWRDATNVVFRVKDGAPSSETDGKIVLAGGTLTNSQFCTWDDTSKEIDCNSAGGGGDSITVATVAATDPDFISTGDIAFTLDTGATPDTIAANIAADVVNGAELADTITLDANTAIATGSYAFEFTVSNPTSPGVSVEGTGNFAGDLLHVHQNTGNPTASNLIHAEAADADVSPLVHIDALSPSTTGTADAVIGLLIDTDDDNDTSFLPLLIQDDNAGTPDDLLKVNYQGNMTLAGSISALGGTMSAELFSDATGIEFEPGDALTDCSTFSATGGGIFYDDSEGLFKKCQDNTLTKLLTLPNGTGASVAAAGDVGVDTTDDQLIYYGGAKRVIPYTQEKCVTLQSPVEADDNIPFFHPRDAITITDVYCQIDGGTSISLTISDGTNALEAITCDDDGAEDDGSIANGTFTSLERMEFDLASPSGTNTWLSFCITYTVDAQ